MIVVVVVYYTFGMYRFAWSVCLIWPGATLEQQVHLLQAGDASIYQLLARQDNRGSVAGTLKCLP